MTAARRPCEHTYPHIAHKHRNPAFGSGVEPYELRCPGVKAPAGARHYAPSARREVLARLRKASKYLGYTVTDWAADSRVWEHGHTRPRRVDEYPENSRKAWSELASDLDTLISALSTLRGEARTAADHIERVERARDAQRLP